MPHRCILAKVSIQLIPIFFILAQPVQAEKYSPAGTTTLPERPPIFIGHPPQKHYVIVLPLDLSKALQQLARIREKASPTGQTAFITHNALGHYIYVASFSYRGTAEAALQKLLKDEPRARVVYFP